jgi:hypothetical protein
VSEQIKMPQDILEIVDEWLEENAPTNVEMFSFQVTDNETWARVKAWRDNV